LLSKCANPGCFARFHTLRKGRLFKIEINPDPSSPVAPSTRIEYFWLCEDCAPKMKVAFRDGGVTTLPLTPSRAVGAGS